MAETHAATAPVTAPPPQYDEKELMQALRNAHNAGDTKAAERFAAMIDNQRKYPQPKYGRERMTEPPAELSWPGALRLGTESMDRTFNELAVGSRTPGVWMPKAAEAVGGLASAAVADPIGFAKNAAVGAVDAIEHFGQDIVGIAGSTPPMRALDEYVQSSPALSKVDRLLGGDPLANERRIKQAKKDVAERPYETAFNVAAIPGSFVSLPKLLWKAGQAASGARKGAKLLGGEVPEFLLEGDMTKLDLLSPDKLNEAMEYMSAVRPNHPARLAFEEQIANRDKYTWDRWRKLVEETKGLQPGDLNDPSAFREGVVTANKEIEDFYTTASKEAKDIEQKSLNEQFAAETADLTKRRDAAYDRAYTTGPDVDLENFSQVLSTETAGPLLEKMNKLSADYAKVRKRGGMPNLEKIDKIEYELGQMAEQLGIGTAEGQLASQLARKIRNEIDTMDLPDYKEALELHAKLKTGPQAPPKANVGPAVPEDVLAQLEDNLRIADETIDLSKQAKLNLLINKIPEADWKNWLGSDTNAVQADLLSAGLKREKAFRYLEGKIRGMKPDRLMSIPGIGGLLKRNWGPIATGASYLLGYHPAISVGMGAVAGAKLLGRARKAQIGKQIYRQALDPDSPLSRKPPPDIEAEALSKLDWTNITYAEFLAHEKQQEAGGHH